MWLRLGDSISAGVSVGLNCSGTIAEVIVYSSVQIQSHAFKTSWHDILYLGTLNL